MALFGYDPVAFHFDGRARPGKPEIAGSSLGKSWRFATEANRAAFLAEPNAYLPHFGGHDGALVADGIMAVGDPTFFVISGGAVVLFRNEANRDRYAGDAALRATATTMWPKVLRQFAGH